MAYTVDRVWIKVALDDGNAVVYGDVSSVDGEVKTAGNFAFAVTLDKTTLEALVAVKNTALATHGIP